MDFLETFEKEVAQLAEVQECYHIAGHYDYMLKVNIKDIETYFIAKSFIFTKLFLLKPW